MSKIAIIEDDIAIVQMYRMKFEAEGYEVITANNGNDGLLLLEQDTPDVVLLDLMMPEMDGAEMLAKLRKTKHGKDLKVIILTNMGESEAPPSISKHNALGYIVKAEMTPRQVAEYVKSKL